MTHWKSPDNCDPSLCEFATASSPCRKHRIVSRPCCARRVSRKPAIAKARGNNRSVFPTETTPREPVLYPCRTTGVTERQTRRGLCGRYWRNVQSPGSGGARQHSAVSFESHHASDAIGL